MSVLERVDCSAVGSLHLIQVRFLCSFYYETSRLSRSLMYTSVPGSVGFKGRALCLLLKDDYCFSYLWTTSGVFKSFSYYLANLANSNWKHCSDHTFWGFSILYFVANMALSVLMISVDFVFFFPCLPLSHTLKSSQKLPGSPCRSIHGGLMPPSVRNNGGAISFLKL